MLSENYSHLLAFLNRSNNLPDKKNNRKSSSFFYFLFFFYRFLNHFWSYSFDRKWGNVRSTLRLYRNESSPPTCSGHTTLHHLRNYAASLNRSWNKSEMLQFRKWNKDKTYWSCFQAWMKKKITYFPCGLQCYSCYSSLWLWVSHFAWLLFNKMESNSVPLKYI